VLIRAHFPAQGSLWYLYEIFIFFPVYIYASKDLPSYNSIASGLAGFPYWHFPSLVDSLERTFQCIVINHFAAKTSWTPRPHIWLPHAVDIPLCVPGKWPWLEWGWGKNSRAGKFEAVRVRERNVKVESVELYVKWWAWLEFPSCWNSTSTYFYPAALAWHMSSSSAIHVLKYKRILWFFFLCCFWLHYYHRHLADLSGENCLNECPGWHLILRIRRIVQHCLLLKMPI